MLTWALVWGASRGLKVEFELLGLAMLFDAVICVCLIVLIGMIYGVELE